MPVAPQVLADQQCLFGADEMRRDRLRIGLGLLGQVLGGQGAVTQQPAAPGPQLRGHAG